MCKWNALFFFFFSHPTFCSVGLCSQKNSAGRKKAVMISWQTRKGKKFLSLRKKTKDEIWLLLLAGHYSPVKETLLQCPYLCHTKLSLTQVEPAGSQAQRTDVPSERIIWMKLGLVTSWFIWFQNIKILVLNEYWNERTALFWRN